MIHKVWLEILLMPTPSSKEFNTHWHLFSFFLSLIFLDKFSIANYDARTRQNGCCTCVWLGNARATPLPTRWCCVWVFVCLFAFFFFLKWIHADSASIHADSRQIGLFGQNQIVSAESNCIGWQSKLTKMAEIGLKSCIALAKNWNLSLSNPKTET